MYLKSGKCAICDLEFERLNVHVCRKHGSVEEYLIKHVYGGERPKCKCGCGQETKFTKSMGMGFKDYIHGHHAVGHVVTDEMRKKIGDKNSVNITKKYLEGGWQWAKGYHLSPKTEKKHYYRSSWELRHMQELDADPLVVTYESEPFSIEYEYDRKSHRYIPDFIVTYRYKHTPTMQLYYHRKELHEIGPKTLKATHPKNVAKREAAIRWCHDLGYVYRLVSFQ